MMPWPSRHKGLVLVVVFIAPAVAVREHPPKRSEHRTFAPAGIAATATHNTCSLRDTGTNRRGQVQADQHNGGTRHW